MAKIHTIRARSILDSSGYPTVEATIWLDNGAFGVSSTSANTTNSKNEAFEIRDKDPSKYFGLGVDTAVNTINTIIAPKLKGLDPTQQSNIDKILLELDGTKNKSKLGANAILPVSIATLKAGASLFHMPVYEYIGKKYQLIKDNYIMPMPIIAIINGGKYGLGSLDFQEFQIIPSSRHAFPEAMRLGTEVYHAVEKSLISNDAIHSTGRQGGFTPNLYTNIDALEIIYEAVKTTSYFTGQDLFLGIDAAADDIYKNGKYSIKDRSKSIEPNEFIEYYQELNSKYHLFVLEDPLEANDSKGWSQISLKIGKDTLIIADKITSGNKGLIENAIKKKVCTAISIKPNQIGTISEIIEIANMIKQAGLNIVVSSRLGETNDTFLADLAVGIGAEYVKFGAISRGERIVKYNRLTQIYEVIQVNNSSK